MPEPLSAVADELAAVRTELTRIDSKCGILTGLAGAAVAIVATQTTGRPITVQVLLATACLVLAAAAVILLTGVLRPRPGPTGFYRWALMDTSEILRTLDPSEPGGRGVRTAEDLAILSRLTVCKQRRLRYAVDLLALGLVLVVVAAVMTPILI